MSVYGYYVFQNPPYRASRQLLIPRIAAAGTSFGPLPCQAWNGYGVTSAHRVEVEVGADGPASAPLSGAAAAAPPAGAGSQWPFLGLRPSSRRSSRHATRSRSCNAASLLSAKSTKSSMYGSKLAPLHREFRR